MKHWHQCAVWWNRGLTCPFGGGSDDEPEKEEEEGQEQEKDLGEEEAIRTSVVEREAHVPTTQPHKAMEPAMQPIGAVANNQVGMVDAITVARGIPVPAELTDISRILGKGHAGGVTVDQGLTNAIGTKVAAAESGPRGVELLAGLPGGDARVAIPASGTVPFRASHAAAAEGIVADFFRAVQVQSEETGAFRSTPVNAVQEQSEEVPAQRTPETPAEFANFREQAAALTILASLGIGMVGLERANFLGTQTQVGGSQPVPNTTSGRPEVRTGTTGQLGRQTRISTSGGGGSSGDFQNMGRSMRNVTLDRRFDTAVR